MKVVYVSGPYRDARGSFYVHQNIERARNMAAALWAEGFVPICPHANSAHMDGAVSDATFLEGDLELVRRSDAIVLLDGWEDSEGAKAEAFLAGQLGKVVYYCNYADPRTDAFRFSTLAAVAML